MESYITGFSRENIKKIANEPYFEAPLKALKEFIPSPPSPALIKIFTLSVNSPFAIVHLFNLFLKYRQFFYKQNHPHRGCLLWT